MEVSLWYFVWNAIILVNWISKIILMEIKHLLIFLLFHIEYKVLRLLIELSHIIIIGFSEIY